MLLAVVMALAGYSIIHASPLDGTGIRLSQAKPALALSFQDKNGKRHSLADFQGKLRIVHLWATWCGPCVAELPQIDAVASGYASKGIVLLAIALEGGGVEKVQNFFAAHGITHLAPNNDGENAIIGPAAVRGLPTTLFLNARGEEIARAEGPLNWKNPAITAFIEEQLKAK